MSDLPIHTEFYLPQVFTGQGEQHGEKVDEFLKSTPSPPWREFGPEAKKEQGKNYRASEREIQMLNLALYLRRPLLVTGRPGVGKSSLAYAAAYELDLGDVLHWQITTHSVLKDGLYFYDAIGRFKESKEEDDPKSIGRFFTLGPLGTAFAKKSKDQNEEQNKDNHAPVRPRVLLIDEIDKSDVDLPNNLLHIFEEGFYEIPELKRLPEGKKYDDMEVFLHGGGKANVHRGRVDCRNIQSAFPLVIMTSNGEREFPPAFLRRCLCLNIEQPDEKKLKDIVEKRLKASPPQIQDLIEEFVKERDDIELSTDQLLNAAYLLTQGAEGIDTKKFIEDLKKAVWHPIG